MKTQTTSSLLIALTIAWLAPLPAARAVSPPPDGGYPVYNTAEGQDALFSLTTGIGNTAVGYLALYYNTSGGHNSASGSGALFQNTTGSYNTAVGDTALYSNTTGNYNTATGNYSLSQNNGNNNTAHGFGALDFNTTGDANTALGFNALVVNSTGQNNTASGIDALRYNTSGNNNTAMGMDALYNNTTGSSNIAIGNAAGSLLTTGSNNIEIAHEGNASDANTIRIGKKGIHTKTVIAGIRETTVAGGISVLVDSNGRLGTTTSSERFKDAIKPMDKASEALLALEPVTFRYKHELDHEGTPQFGLVAEQVAKVNPALVVRDDQGKPYTVRYEAVNAMLLNEFLKEHRKVEEQARTNREQEATITELKSAIAQQQKETKALSAALKEQGTQLQKVSDQVELRKPAPRLVAHHQ